MVDESNYASRRFKQADDIVARQIAGEMLLVPIRQNISDLESIYTLNEMGTFLWALLDGSHSLGEICAIVETEFDVSHEEAWSDLREFVSQLLAVGALQEVI